MKHQDQKEVLKRDLEEKLTPICQALTKLAKDFKVDVFLAVNAPQLGTYQQMNQIHRLATVDRLAEKLQELRSNTTSWLNARLTVEDERSNDGLGKETP